MVKLELKPKNSGYGILLGVVKQCFENRFSIFAPPKGQLSGRRFKVEKRLFSLST
jgi:hypothetical protein